jgi:hypothetical protein
MPTARLNLTFPAPGYRLTIDYAPDDVSFSPIANIDIVGLTATRLIVKCLRDGLTRFSPVPGLKIEREGEALIA